MYKGERFNSISHLIGAILTPAGAAILTAGGLSLLLVGGNFYTTGIPGAMESGICLYMPATPATTSRSCSTCEA